MTLRKSALSMVDDDTPVRKDGRTRSLKTTLKKWKGDKVLYPCNFLYNK